MIEPSPQVHLPYTPIVRIPAAMRTSRYECFVPDPLLLAPHDLRRTCALLCHLAGGELEQIQFLLGHISVQRTERYLGCKQRLRNAVTTTSALNPKRSP